MKTARSACFSLGLLVALGACQPASVAPAPQLPKGMTQKGKERFGLDVTTPVYNFAVKGDGTSSLRATLAGPDGQRALSFHSKNLKCPVDNVEIASAGHHVLSEAATDSLCHTLVCWNHLPGNDTELTIGPMPDPTQGVDLYCRLVDGQKGAGTTHRLGQLPTGKFFKAAWLRDVTAHPVGFKVSYYVDDGWFGGPVLPEHAFYVQDFSPAKGQLNAPKLVRTACPQ